MSTRARHHCFLRRVETDRLDQQQHGGHRLQPESLWIRLIKAATSNTDLILTIHCSYFFRHIRTNLLKILFEWYGKAEIKKKIIIRLELVEILPDFFFTEILMGKVILRSFISRQWKKPQFNFLSQNLNMERNFFKWNKNMILPKFLQNLEKYNILCVYFSFSSFPSRWILNLNTVA